MSKSIHELSEPSQSFENLVNYDTCLYVIMFQDIRVENETRVGALLDEMRLDGLWVPPSDGPRRCCARYLRHYIESISRSHNETNET